MTSLRLGVVADDVTGACDLADAVTEAGAHAAVLVGVPGPDAAPPACDCAIIALKSRTAPVAEAVEESVAAARWLLKHGAQMLYQKYCSTFDSTDLGNIGPVADALRALLRDRHRLAPCVGTPATPRAGRTQYQGHLFVGPRLLSESSLRDHPLTPMRDPDLVRVLSRQTPAPVALVPWATVHSGALGASLAALTADGAGHVLVDALNDDDLDLLARAVEQLARCVLLGGAAGLAAAVARRWGLAGRARTVPAVPDGPSLVIAGSCAQRTRMQVAEFGGPRIEITPSALHQDPGTVDRALDRIAAYYREDPSRPVLVTSSAPPEEVAAAEAALGPTAASLLERAAGRIAARAVHELGVRRLIVAGGETSGAVIAALDAGMLAVGPPAAPGVPWMVPIGLPVALLPKSGNFGAPDLFRTAWSTAP